MARLATTATKMTATIGMIKGIQFNIRLSPFYKCRKQYIIPSFQSFQ